MTAVRTAGIVRMVSTAKDLEEERKGLESRLETKQLGIVWQARPAQGVFIDNVA